MTTQINGIEADYLAVLNSLDEYDQDAVIKYIGKLNHEIMGLKNQVRHLQMKLSKYKTYYTN